MVKEFDVENNKAYLCPSCKEPLQLKRNWEYMVEYFSFNKESGKYEDDLSAEGDSYVEGACNNEKCPRYVFSDPNADGKFIDASEVEEP